MHLILKLAAITIIVSGFVFFSSSAIDISGDISSVEFLKEQNPYNVTGDVYVPVNKKVIIPSGVVILFKALDNITLTVEGSLVVHGTKEEPVIFTSSYDPQYNPDSLASVYDWAGIKISGSAQQVMLRFAVIRYARNPLETRTPTTRFENVKFSDNMYSQLIINGKEIDVSQEQVFNYPAIESDISDFDNINKTEVKKVEKPIKLVPDNINKDAPITATDYKSEKNKWWHKKTVRFTMLGLSLVTAGYSVAAIVNSNSHAEKHDDLMADYNNDDLPSPKREAAYYDAKDENKISNAMLTSGVVSSAVSGICILGFVFTLTF